MRALLIVLLISLLGTGFAFAKSQTATEMSQTELQLPQVGFSPGIEPLLLEGRFARRAVLPTNSKKDVELRSRNRLTFEQRPNGYLCRWETLDYELIVAPEMRVTIEPILAALKNVELKIAMDRHGAPVAIENMPEVRAALTQSIEKISDRMIADIYRVDIDNSNTTLQQKMEMRSAIERIFSILRKSIENQSDDSLSRQYLSDSNMLFFFGHKSHSFNGPVAWQSTTDSLFGGPPIKTNGVVHATMHQTDRNRALLTAKSQLDAADVKASAEKLIQKILTSTSQDQTSIGRIKDSIKTVEVTDNMRLEVDPATGLPFQLDYEKRMSINGDTRIETRHYERTRPLP